MSLSVKLANPIIRSLFITSLPSSQSSVVLLWRSNTITTTGSLYHHQTNFKQNLPIVSATLPLSRNNSTNSQSVIHDQTYVSSPILLAKDNAKQDQNESNDNSKPTQEQLQLISDRMADNLPNFFKVAHDFRIYNRNVVFEDNIRNIRTVGLNAYAWQIALVKMGAHLKYGKVNMQVLKITSNIEDGTVKIRWRILTYPGNSVVFAFWQFKLWKVKESIEEKKDEWIDGFSVFHVGGDGLVHTHICDKVIPDTEQTKPVKDSNLAVKLGIALGLIPGTGGGAQSLIENLFLLNK